MDSSVVTIELPAHLYDELKALAAAEHTDPATVIAHLIAQAQQQHAAQGHDPVFELIGVYRSDRSLIDGIPVSEDPDLYAAAEFLGARVERLHAWDIAPARYTRGEDGRPFRRASEE